MPARSVESAGNIPTRRSIDALQTIIRKSGSEQAVQIFENTTVHLAVETIQCTGTGKDCVNLYSRGAEVN